MKKNLSNYGFTLIELIIVIAIIAVLATTIISVINPVEYQKVSRDTVRLSNLNSISQALELYFAENKSYPASPLPSTAEDLSEYNSRLSWVDPSGCKYVYENVGNAGYKIYSVKESKSFSVPAGQVLVKVIPTSSVSVNVGCNVTSTELIQLSNQQ